MDVEECGQFFRLAESNVKLVVMIKPIYFSWYRQTCGLHKSSETGCRFLKDIVLTFCT